MRKFQSWVFLLVAGLLAGCASVAPGDSAPPPERLFQDAWFKAPTEPILSAEQLFALSPAMQRYLDKEIGSQLRSKGGRQGLLDALYNKSQLQLEYDSSLTRYAAQAFEDRRGNCLSLVIMTAAFAKQLGLPLRYQSVYVDEVWSRDGGLYFLSGHVNMSLGQRLADFGLMLGGTDMLTIDFMPSAQAGGLRTQVIEEHTIVAMFMNNRAAEHLHAGRLDDAYGWGRAAVAADPKLLAAYNTLGVIYRRHGDVAQAELILRYVLSKEPANTQVLSNLILVLRDLGRESEAQQMDAKLKQLQPYPPYRYFDLGVLAMQAGDFGGAKDLFSKEIARAAYVHEFHFWLALANYGLGNMSAARKQIALALENSTTRPDRDRYAAKLDWLKSRMH